MGKRKTSSSSASSSRNNNRKKKKIISTNNYKDAFLIRTYNPSTTAIQRILKWCIEIKNYNNNNNNQQMDFWISIDCTLPRLNTILNAKSKVDNHGRKRIECGVNHADTIANITVKEQIIDTVNTNVDFKNDIKIGTDIYFHEYTESDLISLYPKLNEINSDKAYSNSRIKKRNGCSLAWGMHCEAINYWYRDEIINKSNTNSSSNHDLDLYYKNIWVFEDDVGYSGNICNLLSYYKNNEEYVNADVITSNLTNVKKRWFWRDTCSENYNINYPMKIRYQTQEHCQRFSSKFLNHLHMIGIEKGCHAWSESFVPTACLADGFILKFFEKSHIGPTYAWNGRVEAKEWEKIINSYSNRPRDKLYHALKY